MNTKYLFIFRWGCLGEESLKPYCGKCPPHPPRSCGWSTPALTTYPPARWWEHPGAHHIPPRRGGGSTPAPTIYHPARWWEHPGSHHISPGAVVGVPRLPSHPPGAVVGAPRLPPHPPRRGGGSTPAPTTYPKARRWEHTASCLPSTRWHRWLTIVWCPRMGGKAILGVGT